MPGDLAAIPPLRDAALRAGRPIQKRLGQEKAKPEKERQEKAHLNENDTYIHLQDFPMIDDLLAWLIDK